MVFVKYKKYGLIVGHLWFCDSNSDIKNVDILYAHGQNENSGALQNTLITDLTQSEDDLYRKIRKNYRYEIRRAGKENIQLNFYSAKEMRGRKKLLSAFANTYNQMYKSKGLHVRFNLPLVEQYMEENAICFTIAFSDGVPLVFHSYIIDECNTRFFYSASPFRVEQELAGRIGCMNKALHWFDLKLFKNKGIRTYDWGGIADFESPNGIDRFKMGFGGTPRTYYNRISGCSLIGKSALLAARIKAYFFKE